MKISILGNGEIGSSLSKLLREKNFEVSIKDLNFENENYKNCDILHICIPYSPSFENIICDEILKLKPKLTIIESTIQVGTTRKIWEKIRTPIAHSPVRGMHPNLMEGIKTFVKFVGPIDKESERLAKDYYEKLNVNIIVAKTPEETEMGKLLDTLYYGWNIVFCKEVKEICDKFNLDFNLVYTQFNKTYNDGYSILNKKEVVRPVLKPMEGPIGGHCIIPNAKILNNLIKNNLTELILKKNEEYKK